MGNEQKRVRMASDVKQRMIEKAVVLLARKGLQRASFSEVLEAAGAPRGSLYHHFPGGKNELVLAAMNEASRRALAALDAFNGQPADKVAGAFCAIWASVLTRSRLEAGCAVVAVTLASDSPLLRKRAGEIFKAWRELLSRMLADGGVSPDRAEGLAANLIAACEGAVAVARAENSITPFDLVVAEQLRAIKAAIV
jgi:TetR/AcrR family transcriptional repressor of lmrAB and yxaGH operons